MTKSTTKKELINAANIQYNKLWNLIDSMSEEEQNKDFIYNKKEMGKEAHWERDQNIRDIFIHLYEWQQLLLKWVDNNMNGKPKPFLKEPYNWKNYGEMNIEFWKQHQNTPYNKTKERLNESHTKVLGLMEHFSDEELFVKTFFSWTGTSSLGQYFISTTSSHYDWAIKKIKAHIRSLKS